MTIMVKAGDLSDKLPDIEGVGEGVSKKKPLNVRALHYRESPYSISDRYAYYSGQAVGENAVAHHERQNQLQKGIKDPREEMQKTARGRRILDVVEVITPVMKERINQVMAETFLHMRALEKRVIALEQKAEAPLVYRGVWSEGEYEKNSAVTHVGSLWIAKRTTRSKPQPDAAEGDWQLAVRRGRDGKDAKP